MFVLQWLKYAPLVRVCQVHTSHFKGAPKITIQKAWQRARERTGYTGLHFHDLRHSAASAMVNQGVDLYTVGKVLGHQDQRSTKRYAHLAMGTLVDAVAKIGRKSRTTDHPTADQGQRQRA